jgi:hypothetical protein
MQLIKALEAARGNGTSMISLILPPKDQVCAGGCCCSVEQLMHGVQQLQQQNHVHFN